jgi:uncharacterized membrane protein (DUF2068 family)
MTELQHARDKGSNTVLRTIAVFEAVKGVLALAAGMGLLSLVHHDLHRLVAAFIGHIGLDPGAHYPAALLHEIDLQQGGVSRSLILAVSGYVCIRLFEAYGLWHARPWGEWLSALSGALYVPFEMQHLLHRPSFVTAAVIAFNIALVGYLARRLWHHRR